MAPVDMLHTPLMQSLGAALFGIALAHTFGAKYFEVLAHRHPRHAGLLHLLGEVEVVFGFWAFVLIAVMALVAGGQAAISYAESLQYTEPLFVFVVMVVAASKPVMEAVRRTLESVAHALPLPTAWVLAWLGLAAVPLLGSFITEPAAMTLAALMLRPQIFRQDVPDRLKYAALGVLFVNVSIGGTLTAYAAPPVLMVAGVWQWDTAFMASTFGWKAALTVLVNATGMVFFLRKHLAPPRASQAQQAPSVPWIVSAVHLLFLAGVVALLHHPVLFLGLFLLFLGFTKAYARCQSPLILKEALLVGFFLGGLVVLGGLQRWWLQPLVSDLAPNLLFFCAMALTAITDNAALTYLGSLTVGLSDASKYMLVAGAVAGGGLTVIANAPNPAGAALLRSGFENHSIGVGGLFIGALLPTALAALFFLIL